MQRYGEHVEKGEPEVYRVVRQHAAQPPEPITWYGDQPTVHLPISPQELFKTEPYLGPVQWVVMTADTDRRLWQQALADRPDLDRRATCVRRVPLADGGQADIWHLTRAP